MIQTLAYKCRTYHDPNKRLLSILCNVRCTMYSVQCNVYCTLYNVHCMMYNVHGWIHIVQCTLHDVQCSWLDTHCTMYTLYICCAQQGKCARVLVTFTARPLRTNHF